MVPACSLEVKTFPEKPTSFKVGKIKQDCPHRHGFNVIYSLVTPFQFCKWEKYINNFFRPGIMVSLNSPSHEMYLSSWRSTWFLEAYSRYLSTGYSYNSINSMIFKLVHFLRSCLKQSFRYCGELRCWCQHKKN